MCIRPPPTLLTQALDPLRQHFAQRRIIAILIHMMYADVSFNMSADGASKVRYSSAPLKVIRPGILVLSIRTEGADVAGTIVDQPVPDHLVLALETLSTFTSRTLLHGAEIRSLRAMHVPVRAARFRSAHRVSHVETHAFSAYLSKY